MNLFPVDLQLKFLITQQLHMTTEDNDFQSPDGSPDYDDKVTSKNNEEDAARSKKMVGS